MRKKWPVLGLIFTGLIGLSLVAAGIFWAGIQDQPVINSNPATTQITGKGSTKEAPDFLFAIYGDKKKNFLGLSLSSGESLKQPLAVTVAPDGRIFIADSGNSQIQVFSEDGKRVSTFGQGKLNYPFAMTFRDNRLYVADPNLAKIFVFDDKGKELPPLLDNLKPPREFGPGADVIRPTAIQVGPNGLFYVADVSNQGVIALDDKGQIKQRFGGPGTKDGSFQYPNGLWVDKKGRIHVADSNNGRIQIFDSNGKFLSKIDGTGSKTGHLSLPRGLNVTDDGTILVVDVFLHNVRAFDPAGNELWVLGGLGTDNGQFNFPNGLWLDNQGRLFVTDRENNRVQVFGYKAE